MRIAIDVFSARLVTGLGEYTRNITNALVKSYPNINWTLIGDQVSLEHLGGGLNADKIDLAGKSFGYDRFYPAVEQRHVWRKLVGEFIEHSRPDIIYSPTYFLPLGKNLPPMVATIHDVLFRTRPQEYPEVVRNFYDDVTLDACTRASALTCVSRVALNELKWYYNISVDRTFVVHEGIASHFTPTNESEIARVKKQYHIPDNYIISVIGGFSPRKNVSNMVKAYQLARDNCINNFPSLVIVSMALAEMPTLIDAPLENVKIISYVEPPDLPAMISGSRSVLYPSLEEGFGLPVLEGIACGVPVVTSNIPIFQETIGDSAIFTNSTDIHDISRGIINSLTTLSKQKAMESSTEVAKNFTWEKAAKDIIGIIEKISHDAHHGG